jgi:hypothetical protein
MMNKPPDMKKEFCDFSISTNILRPSLTNLIFQKH